MKVAVLGASPKADRYANIALHRLREAGHEVVGVNPALPDLGGFPCVATVDDLPDGIDTATVYLGKARSDELADQILSGGFRRVVFNPGAENPGLEAKLSEAGVEVLEACTLVMLSTRQF
jgi:predicted CoA-binding protein